MNTDSLMLHAAPWSSSSPGMINCFHRTGVITVAAGVELAVGRSYALTVEAMDNGPAAHRR